MGSEVVPRKRLTAIQRRQLMRELATGDITKTALAAKYGITQPAVSDFARNHAVEIEDLRVHMYDQFFGLWAASKENRLIEYQEQYRKLDEDPKSSHHEWVKAKALILHNVAEELGQLPPRTSITVVPVNHVIVGVSDEDLT